MDTTSVIDLEMPQIIQMLMEQFECMLNLINQITQKLRYDYLLSFFLQISLSIETLIKVKLKIDKRLLFFIYFISFII